MISRPDHIHRLSPATETAADEALRAGDRDTARAALFDGIRHTYAHSPEDYHHFALKAVALPFYELIQNGANDQRIDEAYNVYGWTGYLIDSELQEIKLRHDTSRSYGQRIGRVSELVVFGLMAREFSDSDSPIPLPASRADDTSPEEGTDFYLTSLQPATEFIRLQVKTRIRASDRQLYPEANVRLVGLSDIDPYYGKPAHYESLASRILRDLEGTSTDEDVEALAAATEKLFMIIAEQVPCESAS